MKWPAIILGQVDCGYGKCDLNALSLKGIPDPDFHLFRKTQYAQQSFGWNRWGIRTLKDKSLNLYKNNFEGKLRSIALFTQTSAKQTRILKDLGSPAQPALLKLEHA